MVLDLESRCPPRGTLRMIQEEENQKYCYPFKEYEPGTSSMSQKNGTGHRRQVSQSLYANISPVPEEMCNSQLRGSKKNLHLYSNGGGSQNIPPPPPDTEPPPLPPRRSTSLFGGGGGSATLTLLRLPKPRESTSLNPKRISIAKSSFWTGHPDMLHFAGWELGQSSVRTQSVWGTTERGGRSVTESVDIWGDPPAVKKGILLQQRDKLWSRWKERYFILTRDYLNCFRRTTNVHKSGVRLSEMGSFIYKLRLAEVDTIEWETRKSGCMITLVLRQEPKILLRVPGDNYEALHQWYTLLQECVYMSKERRRALRSQHGSMQRCTSSYDPNANKSTGSASPHSSSTKSSSKSVSNSDLTNFDSKNSSSGGSSSRSNHNRHNSQKGTDLLSVRKSSRSPSPRSLLRGLRDRDNITGKYSPLIDDEDDEDYYEDTSAMQIPPPQSQSQQRTNINGNANNPANHNQPMRHNGTHENTNGHNGDEEFKVTLRRRREINNNNTGGGGIGHTTSTSWRLSLAQPHPMETKTDLLRANLNMNNSMRIKQNLNNNSVYATPLDARVRPGSWAPPSQSSAASMFQRTSSNHHWMNMNRNDFFTNNNHNNNVLGTGSGRMRASIYCPSKITSDVTFRKMS